MLITYQLLKCSVFLVFRHRDRGFQKHRCSLGFSRFGISQSFILLCHPCVFLMISCMMFNELSEIDICHGSSGISLSLLPISKRSTSVPTELPCIYIKIKRLWERYSFPKSKYMRRSCSQTPPSAFVLVPMEWIEIVTQFYDDNSSGIFIFIRPQQHFMCKIQRGV